MADPIVVLYSSAARAEAVRRRLFEWQRDNRIELRDAVIAVKTRHGGIVLNQLFNTAAVGAACGAFWGLLIGALFANPLAGALFGTLVGLPVGALIDYGLNDRFMRDAAIGLQPGAAALFLLISKMRDDKLLDHLQGTGGIVLPVSPQRRDRKAWQDAFAKLVAAPPLEMPAE